MEAIGRIGLVIPEVLDLLEHELLQGVHAQAKLLGYDVLVFTDTFNVLDEPYRGDYIEGLENIYQLALVGRLDGILFAAERFHDQNFCSSVYEGLKKLSIPCLVLEQIRDGFQYIFPQQRESMKLLTQHLIEEHNCRSLYCLTGKQDDYISDERLAGFCEAMHENNLTVNESMIFYGDFWVHVPRQLGIDIASGKMPKPDGIVCASDAMATALCDALAENGVSVPEDIAVTGYDGSWYSVLNTPRITTVFGRDSELGMLAVCRLYEMMTGKVCEQPSLQQHIRRSESCGCLEKSYTLPKTGRVSTDIYIRNVVSHYVDQKMYMASDFISRMAETDTMEQLRREIHGLMYTLHHAEEQIICLCEDWKFDFENPEQFRQNGFPENMYLMLSKSLPVDATSPYLFPTADILPSLNEPHKPQLIVFTSLHRRKQIFGYLATFYKNAQEVFLDEHYMSWCDAITNGLDALQRKRYQDYIRQQLETFSVHDLATGLYNKRGLLEQLPSFMGRASQLRQTCACMLISYVQKSRDSVQSGVDVSLMIANALRLTSAENELICRLHDNVFAVIFKPDDKGDKHSDAQRTALLEEKIRKLQGDIRKPQIPELITCCSCLDFDKISLIESFIDDKLQDILKKREMSEKMMNNYKSQLHRLRKEIYLSPQKNWSVEEMSCVLNISRSHFMRMYKSEFNVSCKDDVIAARIEKAKQLLLNTDLHIQDISDECGYNNASHFMRQFKEKVGMSTSQFRRQTDEK